MRGNGEIYFISYILFLRSSEVVTVVFFSLIESLLYAFYHIYEVERPKHYFYLANKCNSFLVVSQGKSAMSRSY